MREKLESEVMDLAIKVLNLKNGADLHKLHEEVGKLYEKLTVLKFAQETYVDNTSKLGHDSSFFDMLDAAFNNKVTDTIEVENKTYVDLDTTDTNEIVEPAIETIKDMVAQMPYETQQVDDLIENIEPKKPQATNDNVLDNFAKDYKDIPIFDRVSNTNTQATNNNIESNEKKSLNDKLKSGGLTIGLNDKLAFVKHLFNNNNTDYERVLSQLNTLNTFNEASNFIRNIVKPDYNNWRGKEDYEERLMEIIESKYS